MKKPLLFILWLLLSLILPACAAPTYDELEAEAKRTGDTTRLDAYERTREKAEAHFLHKANCAEINRVWYCPGGPSAKERRQTPTERQIRKDYFTEKFSRCGCITKAQMRELMDEFQRQLSRQ